VIWPRRCPTCGVRPRTLPTYDTSRRHGYTCHCPTCRRWGPWARTDLGAIRAWNGLLRGMRATSPEVTP